MGLIRAVVVNKGTTDVTVPVTITPVLGTSTPKLLYCSPDPTKIMSPEVPTGDIVTTSVLAKAGTIHGFAADNAASVKFTNPAPDRITIYIESGKTPWPPPPSGRPSAYAADNADQYATRFAQFTIAAGGDLPEPTEISLSAVAAGDPPIAATMAAATVVAPAPDPAGPKTKTVTTTTTTTVTTTTTESV